MKKDRTFSGELIYGKNAVTEAINMNRGIINLYVTSKAINSKKEFDEFAQKNKGKVSIVDYAYLDKMVPTANHQGVVAKVEPYKYAVLEDVIERKKREKDNLFFVVLDQIQDPHNLGAIIRTSAACGVDGIIISKSRSVGVTSAVMKVAVGAVEHVDIIQVSNIVQALKKLKENGFWISGTDVGAGSMDYRKMDVNCSFALVIGNEGKGISRIVREECDFLVHIPMASTINSLNASVASGILMYEIFSKRNPI